MENFITILIRSWRGQTSPEEEQLLKDPARATELSQLEKVWERSGLYRKEYQPDTDSGWQRFRARADMPSKVAAGPRRSWYWLALLAFLLAAGIAYWSLRQMGAFPLSSPPPQTYATLSGEVRSFVLPDGSEIRLEEHSRLMLIREAADGGMEFQFTGEGFFRISPRSAGSFVLYAADTEVKVMGTAFRLRAKEGEDYTRVEVAEGVVAFTELRSQQTVRVEAAQRAICQAGTLEVQTVDPEEAAAWMADPAEPVERPLTEILREVEERYQVTFVESKGTELDCRFVITFAPGSSLEETLENLRLQMRNLSIAESAPGQYRLSGSCH